MAKIQFYKVRDAECDFCEKLCKIVTQANLTYVCAKCAAEIGKHATKNENAVKQEATHDR